MNVPKEGWPVGMLCVFADDHPDTELRGGIVRILETAGPGEFSHETVRRGICRRGELVQHCEAIAVPGANCRDAWEPCKYLRPLTDPDAETQDSDAELEVTA